MHQRHSGFAGVDDVFQQLIETFQRKLGNLGIVQTNRQGQPDQPVCKDLLLGTVNKGTSVNFSNYFLLQELLEYRSAIMSSFQSYLGMAFNLLKSV